MALDTTKIVAYGPFNLTLLNQTGLALDPVLTWTGLKFDVVNFSLEGKEGSVEFEDGTEKYWMEGRTLSCEFTFSELDTTDMDGAEDAKSFTLDFIESGKTFTVTGDCTVIATVDNLKTKLLIRKFGAADSTIASLFSIAATA